MRAFPAGILLVVGLTLSPWFIARALGTDPPGGIQTASCKRVESSPPACSAPPCSPRIVVECPPPEVIFEPTPVEATREKKSHWLGQRCRQRTQTSAAGLATFATVLPSNLINTQFSNSAALALPAGFTSSTAFASPAGFVSPLGFASLGGFVSPAGFTSQNNCQSQNLTENPVAHLAALHAYHEVELKTNLAALEDQKKMLTARLSLLSSTRSAALGTINSLTSEDIAKQVEELNAKVLKLCEVMDRLLAAQAVMVQRLDNLEKKK